MIQLDDLSVDDDDSLKSLIEQEIVPWLQFNAGWRGHEFWFHRSSPQNATVFVRGLYVKLGAGHKAGAQSVRTLSFEPEHVWDALRTSGACVVRLPHQAAEAAKNVFEAFKKFDSMGLPSSEPLDGSRTENHGWHDVGGLSSKYNRFRRGYILQADKPIPDFVIDADAHEQFRRAIHTFVADRCRCGDIDMISCSQFHIKRCVGSDPQTKVAVPPHRDPSLLSLVIHSDSSAGLEFWDPALRRYAPSHHYGPDRATIIAGSLLGYLTRNEIPAPKHRVLLEQRPWQLPRLAATFFFQPKPDTVLRRLILRPKAAPRLALTNDDSGVLTYAEWKRRAYTRYYNATPHVEPALLKKTDV